MKKDKKEAPVVARGFVKHVTDKTIKDFLDLIQQ